jgi:hypothetical protein
MDLKVYIVESDDATTFKIYDQTAWTAYDHDDITAALLSVTYNGVTYTHNILTHMGGGPTLGDGTSVNLMGASANSYYTVSPSEFVVPLNTTYFPDGYYSIKLDVTSTLEGALTDTSTQGFLSDTYLMASLLPLQIDIDNFNYEENRLQFLCIALMQSCKWAGELGRQTQFTTFTTKVNSFLNARDISSTLIV